MNRFIHYLIRGGICVLLFVVYVYGVRPARSAFTQQLIYPSMDEYLQKAEHPSYTLRNDGVALWVTFGWGDQEKTVQYRPQAGFFLLVSLMTLIFASARPKWYIVLGVLHGAVIVLTATLMIASKAGWKTGFILVDLIGRYLVPVVTLAIAAWTVAEERDVSAIQEG